MKNTHSLRKLACVCTLLLFLCPAMAVYGQTYVPLVSPSVILVEQTTGKILYGKNENARMYPASMTKILTALVTIEYLSPDEIILVGNEIRGMPSGYNTNLHFEGESITVRNLLRALMIRSGNETGCILALNTIRAIEQRQSIPYSDAERLFCALMNEKARSLGAMNSNFTNPYGLHDENHYTTAYDMALISRAYMENPLLREIAAERVYDGDSLEGREIEGAKTKTYRWENHNELIMGGPNAYPYAVGIKTGFHDAAGDCLASSAVKNGVELVAVVFFSPDPGRWQDSKLLFDYGFENFAFETFQTQDTVLETVLIADPRLGDPDAIEVLADSDAVDFLSQAELSRLTRRLDYDEAYLSPPLEGEDDGLIRLITPIEKDAVLGTVSYLLDGAVIFTGTFRAAEGAEERTFDTDMDYYIAKFQNSVFTVNALPYWFGGIGLLVGFIGISAALSARRNRRREYRRESRPRGGHYGGYR